MSSWKTEAIKASPKSMGQASPWLPYQGDQVWSKTEYGAVKTLRFIGSTSRGATEQRDAFLVARYGADVKHIWRQARKLGLVPQAV